MPLFKKHHVGYPSVLTMAMLNSLVPSDKTERTHRDRRDDMQDPNFAAQQQQPMASRQDDFGTQNLSHTTVCLSSSFSNPYADCVYTSS